MTQSRARCVYVSPEWLAGACPIVPFFMNWDVGRQSSGVTHTEWDDFWDALGQMGRFCRRVQPPPPGPTARHQDLAGSSPRGTSVSLSAARKTETATRA